MRSSPNSAWCALGHTETTQGASFQNREGCSFSLQARSLFFGVGVLFTAFMPTIEVRTIKIQTHTKRLPANLRGGFPPKCPRRCIYLSLPQCLIRGRTDSVRYSRMRISLVRLPLLRFVGPFADDRFLLSNRFVKFAKFTDRFFIVLSVRLLYILFSHIQYLQTALSKIKYDIPN